MYDSIYDYLLLDSDGKNEGVRLDLLKGCKVQGLVDVNGTCSVLGGRAGDLRLLSLVLDKVPLLLHVVRDEHLGH